MYRTIEKTVALPNQTTIISFDIIGGCGAKIKVPRICYVVLPFYSCPPYAVVNHSTSRKIEKTTPPQDWGATNKSYGTVRGLDAMLWSCNCHAGKGIAAGATRRRYQPAFITSEPTTTPHHRTTIDLYEPIGSHRTVTKGQYCHVGKDIADAATIIAPFTILKWQRKNDHISAPMQERRS
jgi:hypothetical protein